MFYIDNIVGAIAIHDLANNSTLIETKMRFRMIDPPSRGKLELPDVFKTTQKAESFLLDDSGGNTKRFLVFTTRKNLNFLAYF